MLDSLPYFASLLQAGAFVHSRFFLVKLLIFEFLVELALEICII